MEIMSMSKRQASNYKPCKPTLMISIQDGQLQEYPFKERTNHITRSRYVDTLFLYFDDINPNLFYGKPYFPFAFSDSDALKIINFLTFHFEKNDFEDIIIHCQEGVSRSHAVALFIAKYFMKNDKIYKSLLHQEGKVYGGNAYVYDKLIQYLDKQTQKKGQQ
jgi:dual specificity phosphatase, catalytic domain